MGCAHFFTVKDYYQNAGSYAGRATFISLKQSGEREKSSLRYLQTGELQLMLPSRTARVLNTQHF